MRHALTADQRMQQAPVQDGMGQEAHQHQSAGAHAHDRPAAFPPPAFLYDAHFGRTSLVNRFGFQSGQPHGVAYRLFINRTGVRVHSHRAVDQVEVEGGDAG
jgi:hypothetical protein